MLSTLTTKTASGLEEIPAIVLKTCSPELVPILIRVFQLSYDTGIFPDNWKIARVQPVPKKSSKSQPTNYRPISLLPILRKVMEKYINQEVLKFLELHKR